MMDLEEKIRAAHSSGVGSEDDVDDESSDGNASDDENPPGPSSGTAYYDDVKPDMHNVKLESYEQDAVDELDIEDDYDPEAQLLLEFGKPKEEVGVAMMSGGPGIEANYEDARSSFVDDSGMGSMGTSQQSSEPESQQTPESDVWGGISF